MELIYLWIDKYKNINDQGFNFSSQFNCNLKESNELVINENKDYVPDFFANNLNITAIIGKNGSGKSSLLEVISLLYWQGSIRKKDRTFLLYKKKNKFYIFCDEYKELKNNKISLNKFIKFKNNSSCVLPKIFSPRLDFNAIAFTNCITDFTNKFHLKGLKKYDTFYNGVQPRSDIRFINENADNFDIKLLYLLREKSNFLSFINEHMIFENYQLSIYIKDLEHELTETILSFEDDDRDINTEQLIYKLAAIMAIRYTESTCSSMKDEKFYDFDHYDGWESFFNTNILEKIKSDFANQKYNASFFQNIYDTCNKLLVLINEKPNKFQDIFKIEFISEIIKNFSNKHFDDVNEWTAADDTKPSRTILESCIFPVHSDMLTNILENKILKYLLEEDILRCNFFHEENKDYNFLSLSSGEQLYIKFFTNYAYTLENIDSGKNYLFLIDEIELSFHPAWQKKILKDLIYIYKNTKITKNIHILLTSHSPFILSDIPNSNVLFLKDGKQDLGIKLKTFGANIHTLLSDGFFMNDGLIGDFSENKISEIITFYTKTISNTLDKKALKEEYEDYRNRFWHIQSIIGEEYIQQVLKNHLVEIEKILLGKNEAKTLMIKRLRDEASKLEESL